MLASMFLFLRSNSSAHLSTSIGTSLVPTLCGAVEAGIIFMIDGLTGHVCFVGCIPFSAAHSDRLVSSRRRLAHPVLILGFGPSQDRDSLVNEDHIFTLEPA